MPRQKDLKRLVRARMKKTGEAYTTARAQITRRPRRKTSSPTTATGRLRKTATPTPDYAALAGMSDAVIKEKTGCTWERWVRALDHHGAEGLSHRDIARMVREKYKTPDWWTQAVVVGYERIKGLRAIGQRRDGSYEANKSRTYDVPVTTLFEAWADPSLRRRWLDGAGEKVRTATAPKAMRLGWPDRSTVVVGFLPKGKGKSVVAVQHTRLPDRATSDRMKAFWSSRLDALGEALADGA